MGAKFPEKTGLVPRWRDTREDAGSGFNHIIFLKILLQSPFSMKTWADAQYAKRLKALLL